MCIINIPTYTVHWYWYWYRYNLSKLILMKYSVFWYVMKYNGVQMFSTFRRNAPCPSSAYVYRITRRRHCRILYFSHFLQ